MLVIPDFYDRVYVREFVNILLVSLGFKQICVQQVSRGSSSTSTPSTFLVLTWPCVSFRNRLRQHMELG